VAERIAARASAVAKVGEFAGTAEQVPTTTITPQTEAVDLRFGRGAYLVIVDAPPGTSCPVVETVRGADFALLVTEPTPFGLHDLRLMVEVVRELNIPTAVVINRDGIGDAGVDRFCDEAGLPVLMRIPLEREVGEAIAQGKPLIAIRPGYGDRLRDLYRRIQGLVDEAA
jgi:MinD superfamily P-loop ATPase